MLIELSLRLRVFLIFAGLAGAIVVATGVGLWLGYSRLGDPGAAQGFVQAGVLAGSAAGRDVAPGEVIRVAERVAVGTGKGLLLLKSVQPAGKRTMDAAGFVNGARDFVGARLPS